MSFQVERVVSAGRTADGLSRKARRGYDAAVDDLKGRGCAAGGKRLAAVHSGDYPMCERGFYADWRMFTVYPNASTVVIVALDRHTDSSAPADTLASVYPGLSRTGRRRSEQPPCCEDPADPPAISDELREAIGSLFGIK